MKHLLKISVKELNRNELSKIGGLSASLAGADVYKCSCSNGPGTWWGNYGSQDRADQSLSSWCANGEGNCQLWSRG